MGMWLCSALLFIALSVWSLKVVYSAPCAFDVIFSSGGRVISYNSSLNASSCKDTEGCSCIITAPLGHHIRLEFDTFQLSDLMFDGWPVQDWLNVYDGNTTNDVLLGNFTGAMRPFTLQSSSRFMMVMLKRAAYYLRCTFEGVYTYSATKDKPKIKIPSRVVRTVPGHVLWCSAEGFPPINISLLKDTTTLDNAIGKVTSKIFKEGIYTCLARNEVGSDSREIRVTFVDCRNTCSKNDGKVVNGQIENDYGCIKTGSSIDIFKCLPTTATNLTLQWNKISNLPMDAFRHMAALKFLNLEQNEISTFSSDAFKDLKELHELNLQHNHIRNLSVHTFSSMTALQLLDLKFNKIQYLPTGIFSKLTNLRELNLASNTIQNLSAGIFSKQLNLWKLDLEYNMIEKLDERMLPELSDLRYLNLADNKIRNLSAGLFSNQKELSYLDLESNNIQCLPTGIFSTLTILQTLDLGYNKIEKLDERMLPELSDLRYLNLAGNKIKNLSAGLFSNQKELRYLFLQNNFITSIPSKLFGNPTKLKYLLLSDNSIKSIAAGAFTISNEMLIIYMIRTELTEVSIRSFSGDVTNLTVSVGMEDGKIGTVEFMDSNLTERCIVHLGLGTSHDITIVGESYQDNLQEAFGRAGFANNGENEYVLSPCPTGTFVNVSVIDPKELQCLECPAGGFYSDTKAFVSDSCLKCPNGTFVSYDNAPGRKARDCIACPQGTDTDDFAGFRACKCLKGFYRKHLFKECAQCVQAGLKCVKDYATLKPGYWWRWRNETHKLLYKDYTNNLVNTTPIVRGMTSSFFMTTSLRDDTVIEFPYNIPKPYRCPREESCKGDLDSECDAGYQGPLCEVCSAKYYKQLQTCKKCPTKKWMAGQLSIIVAIIAIVVVVIVWMSHKKSKKSIGRSLVDIILGRLKIVIGFYQVTFGLLDAFAYIKWPESLALIGKYTEMLQLNVFQIAPIHCLIPSLKFNAFDSLFAILIMNAAAIIISFVVYGLRKLLLMRGNLDETQRRAKTAETKVVIYRNLFFFLYVTYLSTCSKTANVLPLACRELCDDENETDCPKFLKADYNIKCEGPEYNRLVIVAYCAVIYIIFLPTASLILLWKQGKMAFCTNEEPKKTNVQMEERENMLFCTNGERETTPDYSSETAGNETSDSQDESTEVPIVTGLHFLFEHYNPRSWYWELVETLRKVVLTTGLILVGGESRAYVGLACVMSGLFGMFFAYVSPIVDPFENRLMLTSLAVTFVNLGIGAVSKIPAENMPDSIDPYVDSIMFNILVIGANSLVIGLVVVQYLANIYGFIKVWRKNPQCSAYCCLAILLPLNDLKGELFSYAEKNVLKQQLQTGKMNKPTISSTFKDTKVAEFELEETDDESNLIEARNFQNKTGDDAKQRSKFRGITGNHGDVSSIHELPRVTYETSV